MADTQQGVRHQSARDAAGTVDTYDGDLRALFNAVATVPAGSTFNEAFMLWLQSVTGSSADNINDLAALYASQQEDTYNWSSVGGLGLPTLFDWNPETAQALPGTSTFTRASVAQVLTTTDGTTNWYQEAKSGELRLDGMRRVLNSVGSIDVSTWSFNNTGAFVALRSGVGLDGEDAYECSFGSNAFADARITFSDFASISGHPQSFSVYARKISGTGSTVRMRIGGTTSSDITLSSSFQRLGFSLAGNISNTIRFQNGAGGQDIVFQLYSPLAQIVQNASIAPDSFVDLAVHNALVSDVKYFNDDNGNSIASNIVTEATGTTITGGGYLSEPAATNTLPDSTDFSTWTTGGLTSVVDDGVASIGLNQHTITADTATGVHRIFLSGITKIGGYFIVKSGGSNPIQFVTVRSSGGGGAGDFYSAFDILNGIVTEDGSQSTGRVTDLSAGYYKIEITTTASLDSSFQLAMSDTGTPGTSDASFTAASETLLLYHAQAEDTAFYTSPIITAGSTVTRVADVLTDALYPDPSGSWLFDATMPSSIAARIAMTGGAVGRMSIEAGDGVLLLNVGGGNSTILTTVAGERHKFAASYNSTTGDQILVDDEGGSDSDNETITIPGNTITIGARNISSDTFRGVIHKATIWTQDQTQSELEDRVA